MSTPVLEDHNWPKDPATHVWGPWFPFSQTKVRRACTHPGCSAVEYRDA